MTAAPAMFGEEDEAILRPSKHKPKILQPSERQVVEAICARLRLLGWLCQVNPNEARSAAAGRGMHIRGTIPGFPDITAIGPGGHVAFIEVKSPGAKADNTAKRAHWARQAETRARLHALGHVAVIVTSQDEAVAVLRDAGMIP